MRRLRFLKNDGCRRPRRRQLCFGAAGVTPVASGRPEKRQRHRPGGARWRCRPDLPQPRARKPRDRRALVRRGAQLFANLRIERFWASALSRSTTAARRRVGAHSGGTAAPRPSDGVTVAAVLKRRASVRRSSRSGQQRQRSDERGPLAAGRVRDGLRGVVENDGLAPDNAVLDLRSASGLFPVMVHLLGRPS